MYCLLHTVFVGGVVQWSSYNQMVGGLIFSSLYCCVLGEDT